MKKHPAFVAKAVLEARAKGMKEEEKAKLFKEAGNKGQEYWVRQINDCINGVDAGDIPFVVAALKLNLKALKRTIPKEAYETGMKMVKKTNLSAEARDITPEDIVKMTKEEEKGQSQLF